MIRIPTSRTLSRIAAFCLLAAVIVLCSLGLRAGRQPLDAERPIRMAYLQNDLHHLALWVALEEGFFAEEGIRVEVAGVFQSGPELMTAFGADALDAAYVGEAPATIARIRGAAQVRILAQANTEGSAVVGSMALAEGTKKHPTLAIPGNGSVQDLLLRKALPLLGLDPGAIDIIVLRPPEMLTALQNGQIDGFIAWEPYPSRAVAQGLGKVLASSSRIWQGHPCCVLAVSDRIARERPQDARALLRVHRKATAFILGHPDEAAVIAVKYTGMDEDVVRRALSGVTYTEAPSVAGEEEYVSFLDALGVVKVEDPRSFTREFIADRLREDAGK